jgi:hypothetical protein
VAEGDGLLNRCTTLKSYRGFESLRLRSSYKGRFLYHCHMNPEESFGDSPFVKSQGGPLIMAPDEPMRVFVDRYLNYARRLLSESEKHCTSTPKYPGYVGITSSDKLRPVAFHHKGFDHIALSWGMFGYLQYFFSLVLSFREVLPAYGDSTLEVSPNVSLLKLSRDISNLFNMSSNLVAPKSPGRLKLADYLAQLAVGYLVYHEITHIRCGHLG